MDSTFEIESNYGKLIGENNKLQKLVTDMKLRWDICQVRLQLKNTTVMTASTSSKTCKTTWIIILNLRLLLLAHNQLESLPSLKKLSVKTFYRQETAVSQSVHCIWICFSLIKAAQKFHIMIPKKKAKLKKIISTWLSWQK